GQWKDRSFCYYGPDRDYIQQGEDISDLVSGDTLQIQLAAFDMCDVWYLVMGNCAQHTPSPWFDNLRLYRYKTSGPQWNARELDLFQDNFPGDEFDIESYVRADEANDINTNDNPIIRPGDSVVVGVASPLGGGIAAAPGGGPAVHIHVRCTYIGPLPMKPNLYGPALAGSTVHGTAPPVTVNYRYISDDGVWTIIQCDTARTGGGVNMDRYCVDLNDALFTRGYQIEYYFTAVDNASEESAFPRYARSGPPYYEFTCLPTRNSDFLFVNDCDDRGGGWRGGAESYWVPTFNAVLPPPNNNVDIYHVNSPTSGVSNGPGSRAKNRQLTDQYYNIVWDSGDLSSITISDGMTHSDKSNDCEMLIDWMNLSEHYCGLWICGDGIAADLTGDASTSALTLMHTKCGVTLVNDSYFDLTGGRTAGGVINPLITGDTDAGIFGHAGVPDQFYIFGGCPAINKFDVLDKTANGKWALDYPPYNGTSYHAGIESMWKNGAGADVRTMWFGFSYQFMRDDLGRAPIDRFEIANDVFQFFQNTVNIDITPAVTPKSYRLAQNFPNPFNPSTTIRYDMKEKGLVRIKIYNVAGALVRTVVDGPKDAGAYSIAWDGRNNTGSAVASGIYFCKMEAKGFAETKKMVLLR
ncbi:MAG: FlgD immunoglobulin-like domain containing protein, partial [Candidatus Krumholzibacteriaceae bacterium]